MTTAGTRPSAAPPRAPSRASIARIIAADIKIAHSVFALPFALLAAFMAGGAPDRPADWRRFGGMLLLVIAAMVLARTAAMLANRVLDRRIDARNPRTAGRAIPSGRLSLRTAVGALAAASAGFLLVCAAFGALYGNWWPAALGPPVLAWLAAYSLAKRFTSLAHLWLGSALALSPLAAALAVDPGSLRQVPLWLLSGMVLCWVGGFDVVYALQDAEVDRAQGLYSLPGRLGPARAMWVSRLLHLGAAGLLAAAAVLDPRLGALFAAGVVMVAALLVAEHLTVARWGTRRIALAFFTLNGAISCVLGALGIADVLLGA